MAEIKPKFSFLFKQQQNLIAFQNNSSVSPIILSFFSLPLLLPTNIVASVAMTSDPFSSYNLSNYAITTATTMQLRYHPFLSLLSSEILSSPLQLKQRSALLLPYHQPPKSMPLPTTPTCFKTFNHRENPANDVASRHLTHLEVVKCMTDSYM